eukprot:CAMPEP_0206458988 /NCGR_PEP_ID=MMETSP0324_2-20121206/23908_1 /ASSEMBLY_ACC=CAM_ASM_000836 /TAXON_ID=2866 /ORGANISM="Crypthecodinium cohnii, Strain Seligo" /LENGTH=278 /DNA_ID=CAMNT_0053930453 /DNA_START=36 /DNA_END=872 /DNA_ORIENTATION=+
MSVTGFMYNVNATKALGELELSAGLEGNRSWHNKYKHSAYVYIGGLNPDLSEGDVVIMFSQFGEVIDVNMIRDKATGKSKGFCFVCYEDQSSTVLAVDNMNGYQLLGRTMRVDHVEKYKAPKQLDENDLDENGDPKLLEYKATGAEGKGTGVYNVLDGQKKIEEIQKGKKEVVVKTAKIEDEDEAWAKAFESSLASPSKKDKKDKKAKKDKKKEKKAKKKDKKKELKAQKEELKKMLAEAKRLNEEAKKAKEARKKAKRSSESSSSESSSSLSSSSSS